MFYFHMLYVNLRSVSKDKTDFTAIFSITHKDNGIKSDGYNAQPGRNIGMAIVLTTCFSFINHICAMPTTSEEVLDYCSFFE